MPDRPRRPARHLRTGPGGRAGPRRARRRPRRSRASTPAGSLWDDASVDWSDAALVAVRSTWDYDSRVGEFLGWASGIGPDPAQRLPRSSAGTSTSPTSLDLARRRPARRPDGTADTVADVRRRRPRSASRSSSRGSAPAGRGLELVRDPAGLGARRTATRVPGSCSRSSSRSTTEGETSVFVIGGHAVSQVDKLPSRPTSGCTSSSAGRRGRCRCDARRPARAGGDRRGREPPRRGDRLRPGRPDAATDGTLVVSEVELTEPGLYLDVLPRQRRPVRRRGARADRRRA